MGGVEVVGGDVGSGASFGQILQVIVGLYGRQNRFCPCMADRFCLCTAYVGRRRRFWTEIVCVCVCVCLCKCVCVCGASSFVGLCFGQICRVVWWTDSVLCPRFGEALHPNRNLKKVSSHKSAKGQRAPSTSLADSDKGDLFRALI